MREQLEVFRRDAVAHLGQEQQYRDAQLSELQQSITKLEAANNAAVGRMLRAQKELPSTGECPRCWIWDERREPLIALDGDSEFDRFRCNACGQEIEAPIT